MKYIVCKFENCNEKSICRGYCGKHYAKSKRNGEFTNNICKVENCNEKVLSNEYCQKHYSQLNYHSYILERTTRDPNEIIIHDDFAELIIYNRKHEIEVITIIDLDDIEKIEKHKWSKENQSYIVTTFVENGTKKRIKLHRYIMDITDDKIKVDHEDKNQYNNMKSNLRVCSQLENAKNKSLSRLNKSGISGVFWNSKQGKWNATIKVNYKQIHLGSFSDKNEAIKKRLNAEKENFKEFAPQKHLFKKYGVIEDEI